MKHPHYECIVAWAEGKTIQYKNFQSKDFVGTWRDIPHPSWDSRNEYRIKPERQQWHQDLIDAVKAGKVVEFKFYFTGDGWAHGWEVSSFNQDPENYDFGNATQDWYRVRPEVKPDTVRFAYAVEPKHYPTEKGFGDNLRLTFDGETCELKSAEVIK